MAAVHQLTRAALTLALVLPLAACGDSDETAQNQEPVVRGLRTVLVQDEERTTVRRYPSVLQPSSVSRLSFEIAGRLSVVKLDVGQVVKQGDVLARIDPATLTLQVESAEAGVQKAASSARTAGEDLQRKAALEKKGIVAKAVTDKARDAAESTRAGLVQAEKELQTARKNLTKAVLTAPFDGIVNSVEVDSFANVSAGSTVTTIYSAKAFEASFSVSYEVISLLAVGKKAVVRLADNPATVLDAHVNELGARADTVSSFPVVVALDGTDPSLKAGMAVEISLEFSVDRGKGFALPLTVLALESEAGPSQNDPNSDQAFVYVFDQASSTVKRRAVTIAGVRENALIVTHGLQRGERVASAGVSFLRDGLSVKLLPDRTGQ